MGKTFDDLNPELGCWYLDSECLVLLLNVPNEYYEVDIERCTTNAEVMDWIFQVAGKRWATDQILADLVRALNRILEPQSNLCSGGADLGVIDPKAAVDHFMSTLK